MNKNERFYETTNNSLAFPKLALAASLTTPLGKLSPKTIVVLGSFDNTSPQASNGVLLFFSYLTQMY